MNLDELILNIEQHIEIKAPIGDVYRGVLRRLGEASTRPDGEPMPLILEEWPGGRWFRDRGNGVGHLWGHVQVIKPPVLLELSGPLFMSYPAINHLEVRLQEIPGGTRLDFRHRAIGLIEPEHRAGVSTGWRNYLENIAKDLSQLASVHGKP